MANEFVLPYEPGYVAHREAQKRREEIREWLRCREIGHQRPPAAAAEPVREPEPA